MVAKAPDNDKRNATGAWRVLERHYGKLILAALLLSLLIHAVSVVELGHVARDQNINLGASRQKSVKIKIVQVPPKKKPVEKKKDEPPKPEPDVLPKILEMPQLKTQAPDKADYVGTVDHQAKKEQRIADKVKREKAKDPGQKGNPSVKAPPTPQQEVHNKPVAPEAKQVVKGSQTGIKSKIGKLSMDAFTSKPRNDYEALLPTSLNDLPGQVESGYQDYVDDKIQEGDRIDINTTEYRYIGYFTNMRKAIELVWNYPLDAARKGEQGEVGLEFTINKDGHTTHIKVIKSSGYDILDRAIIEAIKLASPFAPLPEGFRKTRLVVTGSFRYILNAYGSH